ncbi:MAG: BON domain-containing protein [Planctomycetia bacterium]|nr:BON domain-containing protein [Planctomycetia bacterium]
MSISKTTFLLAVVLATCLTSVGRADDLAADVAGKLRDSGALAGYRVNVKSKSGTVWLEGRVADERQLAAAVGITETTPGVERVVNRLVIEDRNGSSGTAGGLALPSSAWGAAGVPEPATDPQPQPQPPKQNSLVAMASGLMFAGGGASAGDSKVQLVQGATPVNQPRKNVSSKRPMPLGAPTGRPMNAGRPQDPRYRTAMRTNMQEPMTLPGPGGYDQPLQDGQIVPGTTQYSEGYVGSPGMPGSQGGMGGPGGMAGSGGPMAMGGTGVGMPPVPMRADGPNMPNYAWPSYAASPNYAAVQYPTQYSPTAWPYIGPFYPYPQVPLGWRRVSLEWDDGWWFLDFDERHIHSHHR